METPVVEQAKEQFLEQIGVTKFQQDVERLTREAEAIQVYDEASEEAATMFITGCQTLKNDMEEARDAIVRPHNDYVRAVNAAFKPFTDILERLKKATDTIKSDYLAEKQRQIEEANRKAIAKAEQEKRELEEKARKEREEAERLRLEAERIEQERLEREFQEEMKRLELERTAKEQAEAAEAARQAGDAEAEQEAIRRQEAAKAEEAERARKAEADRIAAEQEKARLEKEAAKQDVKADTHESRAMTTAPEIQSSESLAKGTRTLLNGTKANIRKTFDWLFTNGLPKVDGYYRDDPRFQGIPDRYFVLDLSKLGKDAKNGVPIDGVKRIEQLATVTRK